MSKALLYGATRTPFGNFGGTLKDIPAAELGAVVIAESLRRAGVQPDIVDEVIMGMVIQAGTGLNPARQSSMKAGIPLEVPSFTVNKVCGSGLKSVALAAQAVTAGDADIVVAGGMENMSRAPYLMNDARWGHRLGHGELTDSILKQGLWDTFYDCHMAMTAEHLAEKYTISREEQDAVAAESQKRASEARDAGRLADEIVAVSVPRRKQDPLIFSEDEYIRTGTTPEILSKLKPVFKEDGTVTAGNASGINDGAAAITVVSEKKASELGLPEPLARVVCSASAGVDPMCMGLGPVEASKKALQRSGISLGDIDLIESNEAFAAQYCVVGRELDWDTGKVNVNGGAIALGHPIGASGTRILVTMLHEMQRRDSSLGLATLCIGGGQGIALIVER